MKRIIFIFMLFICSQLFAQSIFEDAESLTGTACELNGYMRGVLYGGKDPDADEAEIKSGYAETSLKIKARMQNFGDGFAEIRFKSGYEFDEYVFETDLREVYVNAYIGPFDFRIGHQIVVWGRADGFNPTNNITPKNMMIRSPEEDDKREGNILIRSFINMKPFRTELIWIPYYIPSILPGMDQGETDYPDANLKNSAFAAKLNFEVNSFDGSISYFNGYNLTPGIAIHGIEVIPTAYRIHAGGADFSTTAGSFGLRGEFAFRYPYEDYKSNICIPNPDLSYVIGFDWGFGDFSIILQYVGKYVFDYTELSDPVLPEEIPVYEISKKNRMFSYQQNEISHAVSLCPVFTLMHEILSIDVFGFYNLTTEELYIRPKVSYDIADALVFTLGGDIYSGSDDTLYGTIDTLFSAVFIELMASF